MALMREVGKRLQAAILPVLGLCATAYFVHHALEGDRGVPAWHRLNAAIEESTSVLAQTTAERRRWENRVALVKNQGLDLDLLEELARQQLGLVREDELVIYYEKLR